MTTSSGTLYIGSRSLASVPPRQASGGKVVAANPDAHRVLEGEDLRSHRTLLAASDDAGKSVVATRK